MRQSIVLFCALACAMQSVAADELFVFRNKEFLQYYFLWNQFDASVVMYQFGEVVVKSNDAQQRVNLAGLVRSGQKIQGAGSQGINADLEALARTESFLLPAAGQIDYYAKLESFRTPCDPAVTGDDGPADGPNKPTAEWGVLDRTEIVLQLVRADDHTVIAALDSVGVTPTDSTSQKVDTRYGANFVSVKHSAAIPKGYEGVTAYIRLSPRRYGPTPLGLVLNKETHWVNFTALYDSTGTTMISTEQVMAMRNRSFDQLLNYCDSVKSATGWLPDISEVGFTPEQKAIFHNRFFVDVVDSATGQRRVQERRTQHSAKRTATVYSGGSTAPAGRIVEVTPLPVNSGKAEVRIHGLTEFAARIRLFSAGGQDVGVLWTGTVSAGAGNYPLAIPAVANGTYLLSLEKENGSVVASKTIVIVR